MSTMTRPNRVRVLMSWPRGLLQRAVTTSARLVGAALLVAIGLIHLALAPNYYLDAKYVGVSFYLLGVGSLLAAAAIMVGVRGAWLVGGLLAVGAFGGLVVSSTVGLPMFTESLSAPWAMLSLALEGLFVVVYLAAAALRRDALLVRVEPSGGSAHAAS